MITITINLVSVTTVVVIISIRRGIDKSITKK